MTGEFACLQYCAVWGLAAGPKGAAAAGAGCSAICGSVFAAACSTA